MPFSSSPKEVHSSLHRRFRQTIIGITFGQTNSWLYRRLTLCDIGTNQISSLRSRRQVLCLNGYWLYERWRSRRLIYRNTIHGIRISISLAIFVNDQPFIRIQLHSPPTSTSCGINIKIQFSQANKRFVIGDNCKRAVTQVVMKMSEWPNYCPQFFVVSGPFSFSRGKYVTSMQQLALCHLEFETGQHQ